MRLKDNVIIITGSATGIGEAMARRCVEEGARVLIHGLEAELAQQVAGSLGKSAATCIADLSKPEAADQIIAAAIRAFGKIDGLVNNAADMRRAGLMETDAAFFDSMMAVNLRAPLLLCRAALPHLKQSGGAVLNIGSVNGYCGEKVLLPYSLSKAGLLTMTRNLADAYATDGVRFNHFVLGWVATENEKKQKIREGMAADWYLHQPRTLVPSGTMTSPRNIADAAIYWLGDESRPMNGCVIQLEQFPMIGRNPIKD